MRVKFTIAICALLMLGLVVSDVYGQGYRVGVKRTTVVEGGHNQTLGGIQLVYREPGGGVINVPQISTYEVTFGGLTITDVGTLTGSGALSGSTAELGNIDDDNKNQKITITVDGDPSAGLTITLDDVRADVSGLADGDAIMATIAAAGASDEFVFETANDSYSRQVSTVDDGINVTEVKQVSVLTCDAAGTSTRKPSIKVEEGFASAWETDGIGDTDTQIRIIVANVPAGVTFTWPGQGNEGEDGTVGTADDLTAVAQEGFNPHPPAHTLDHDDDTSTDEETSGELFFVSSGTIPDDDTKHYVVYRFMGSDIDAGGDDEALHAETKNVFTVEPVVAIDTDKTGMGGVSDVWAQLWPEKGDDDLGSKLSYAVDVETKDNGYFVNVTECVTYLLFPFLTCGAQADWTTGIAVANTSMDDEAFPVNDGATAQGGSVMIHAYPKSTTAEKMAMGHMSSPEMLADPISTTISGNLAAGDSVAVTCNMHPMLAGFEGYAIVRAGFRHAHGMAFVLGNFMDGAAIDVAHGYIALVIPDPEFAGEGGAPIGRGAVSGETLGH